MQANNESDRLEEKDSSSNRNWKQLHTRAEVAEMDKFPALEALKRVRTAQGDPREVS
jgi:hypothetical protein